MANINTVALLLRDDIVTVHCAFTVNADTEYAFVCSKELANTLELGDAVVVKGNRDFFQVCYVRQVDEECDIDANSGFNYGWVINKIDAKSWQANVEKTEQVVAKLKKRQRQATRQQALAALGIIEGMELLEEALKEEK